MVGCARSGYTHCRSRLRDGLILATWFSGVPAFCRWWLKRVGVPITRILCFHSIPDVTTFKKRLEFLCRRYNTISLDDFVDRRASVSRLNVAVTFDDGASSWEEVLPVMEDFRVPATFFVCSGYLDCKTDDEWTRFCHERLQLTTALPPIGWDTARQIAHHPLFRLGGHTRQHTNLGEMADANVALEEVASDKRIIEDRVGRKIDCFAYPFGHPPSFAGQARNLVKRAGYRVGVTLIPGANTTSRDPLLLYRDCLDEVQSRLLMRAWLAGGYDMWKSFQVRRQMWG